TDRGGVRFGGAEGGAVGRGADVRGGAPRVPAGCLCSPPSRGPGVRGAGARVRALSADVVILQAMRESGGVAVAVSDAQMAKAQVEMARGEGIFACPEGAATLVAAKRLLAEGF